MQHSPLYWNAEQFRWLAPSDASGVRNYSSQVGRSVLCGGQSFTRRRGDCNLTQGRHIPTTEQAGDGTHVCVVSGVLQG
eukprot:3790654-Lingulodinium_polyedra.AAC.1